VIQFAKNGFIFTTYTVVQGGKTVEQHQGDTEYTGADDLPRVILICSEYNQDNQAGNRQNCANQVSDTVESLSFIHDACLAYLYGYDMFDTADLIMLIVLVYYRTYWTHISSHPNLF
jgi:hypothetical protein